MPVERPESVGAGPLCLRDALEDQQMISIPAKWLIEASWGRGKVGRGKNWVEREWNKGRLGPRLGWMTADTAIKSYTSS